MRACGEPVSSLTTGSPSVVRANGVKNADWLRGGVVNDAVGISITVAATQNGATTIEPGQSLRYRYRVIIHPGTVKDADIAGLFTKYTARR